MTFCKLAALISLVSKIPGPVAHTSQDHPSRAECDRDWRSGLEDLERMERDIPILVAVQIFNAPYASSLDRT